MEWIPGRKTCKCEIRRRDGEGLLAECKLGHLEDRIWQLQVGLNIV